MTSDNNEIRSIDAVEIVLRNLHQRLSNYPANSVSRREVVATIFPEKDVYEDVNALITTLIVQATKEEVEKNGGKPLKVVSKEWLEGLTQSIKTSVENIP
jgi:hypothetical protein